MKRLLLCLLAGLLLCPAFSASARDGQNDIEAENLPDETRYALESAAFVQAIEEPPYLYLLTEDAVGRRSLAVFSKNASGFRLAAAGAPLPAMNGLQPTIIATAESVNILYSEALLYHFQPDTDGVWRLTGVQGEHGYRCTKYWLIEQDAERRRLLCGADTSPELARFDPAAFPPDFGAAAEALQTDGYALVSNPNSADRLNLRAEPDASSDSRGKYYNGAPVRVTVDLGQWVRVNVAGVTGYMMKKYLAFGTDMLNVEVAFPDLFIKPSLYGEDLNVYREPVYGSGVAGILTDNGAGRVEVTVIGVAGDDWVHVICGNGLAGYMPAANFYPGNG